MGDKDWEANLEELIEELKIIKNSKEESIEGFDQFCEFIAEPAFERLSDELRRFKIKARHRREKPNSIHFWMNFPRSSIDEFHYIVFLPKDSIELKLKLRIRGRPDKKSPLQDNEEDFMKEVTASKVLKVSYEDLINDVLEQYRKFKYSILPQPEQQ